MQWLTILTRHCSHLCSVAAHADSKVSHQVMLSQSVSECHCHPYQWHSDRQTDVLQASNVHEVGWASPAPITDLVLSPTKLNDNRSPSHHVTIHKLHSSLCLLHSCSGRQVVHITTKTPNSPPYSLWSQQRKLEWIVQPSNSLPAQTLACLA